MYLRNSWYVAGWSRDIAGRPVARTMLEEDIVVFRLANGNVAALEDRCPYRNLPLSMGKVVDQGLQCRYHGINFGTDGRAARARRANHSCRRTHAAMPIWRWSAMAGYGYGWAIRRSPIPRSCLISGFSIVPDTRWSATSHVCSAYTLVTDNLMDLSHVGYVHTSTIGNAAFGEEGSLTVKRTGRGVEAARLARCPPAAAVPQVGKAS